MEYQCSVCQQKIKGDAIMFIDHTQRHIVEVIKKKHPDWVEKNGLCPRCLDYYRDQLKS